MGDLAVSKLTSKYQTTVPSPVREALSLSKGDSIVFETGSDGAVTIRLAGDDRAASSDERERARESAHPARPFRRFPVPLAARDKSMGTMMRMMSTSRIASAMLWVHREISASPVRAWPVMEIFFRSKIAATAP